MAVALIALPFITSPLLHVTATVLVFVSFYLSGMNVRVTVPCYRHVRFCSCISVAIHTVCHVPVLAEIHA